MSRGEEGLDGEQPPEWDGPESECLRLVRGGPALVRGPVRITLRDGRVVISDRFVVAVCRCRLSALYPLCDASHRSRTIQRQPRDSG